MLKPLAIIAVICTTATLASAQDPADWPNYGRDPGGSKYSPLDQITPANVSKLAVAWTYHTTDPGGTWEETPLVINHVMYLASQKNRTIALDADTGKELWSFDPKTPRVSEHRGVSWWPGDAQNPPRVILTTAARLIELDAKTGKPVQEFGDNGEVDLRVGVADNYPRARYGITSPPAVYKNLIILGPATQEGPTKGPSGDPRAFDAKTGKLVWRFHTVPQPGETGNDTWGPDGWKDRSGPSAWGAMTIDQQRGLLFMPIGNPADSFYGADRPGQNLFANSVVCLDATTGKLKWYYQLIHHDVFDADVSAPPALVEATLNGKRVPAVAEFSKAGMLFVLDEATGKPIWGVEERKVPQSDVPGEHTWPTQPFTVKPPPLARSTVTKEEISNISPESHEYCMALFEKSKTYGPYTPFGLEPRITFPSSIGGGNWAGVAFDPRLSYVFVNWSNLGQTGQMEASPAGSAMPYRNKGAYGRFFDKQGYPCNQPPWGELAAVDTKTGNVAWKVTLGSFDELEAKGIRNSGALSLGAPIATGGGVVFIAATADSKFRAFDAKTGKEIWTVKLPAPGNATPMTYKGANGKQYVVIVAGGQGHLPGAGSPGDSVIAYALP
jgi:glucose dehydrogenase